MFITALVLFLCFFSFMLYFSYSYENYISLYGVPNGVEEIISMLNVMFGIEYVVPFNVINLLAMQLNTFWWAYLFYFAVMLVILTGRKSDDFKNMEQGSAHWATLEDNPVFTKHKDGIPCARDFYVPLESDETANLNEIVIGGSGAGKSFRKIKVDLLQLFGSYVVTDPSGELFRDTYRMFVQNHYKVKVLNLTNIKYSNSYNPFAYMHDEQDVLEICTLFMKNSAGEGEKEDFFTGSALELLTCISMYLFHSESEVKSFGRVIRLVNSISYLNGKINPSCELARCMANFAATCKNQDSSVLVSWKGMQNIPEETMGSIAKTLSTRLQLWALSDVDAFMDKDEMEFDKIGFEKTVIFLIIPAAKKTYKVIANLFYSQLFNELMRVAEAQPDGRLKHLVSLEIDEFANIGKIPDFPEILAVIRKYNIRACIVLQGLSQLKAIYEKTYDSIIGNCDIFTFLGSKDIETQKYVSEKLGNTTVRVDQRSYNRGSMQGGGGQDSENYVSRPLLYPNEIPKAVKARGKSRKYGGKCFIWVGYNEPFYLDKYDTLSHPRISECGSKYDTALCTDIKDVYGGIYDERKKAYEKKKEDEAKKLEELFGSPDETEDEEIKVGEEFNPEELVEE
ncbi:MAG: VirD4-like conjugal transfer protein, CD1115 family, partial [Acutalibacteraceae bacterium]